MSIPVFIRDADGTARKINIAYKWSAVRKNNLELHYAEGSTTTVDDAYNLYGVCSALHIASPNPSITSQLDSVYKFLYGYTLNELMEVKETETYLLPGKYFYEPQEWSIQMVERMDWDLFCLSYYSFVCSTNDVESKAWSVLSFILNTLKTTPDLLHSLLSKSGKESDNVACSDFWETVCEGLQTRSLDYLSEKTCYTAFQSMIAVRSLFSIEKYKKFESECFEVLDKIARTRIDEACKETYTVNELLNFDIEFLFFYKDYFTQVAASKETKHYVMNAAFTLLHTIGDKVVMGENILQADAVYEIALNYAQSDADRNLIASKRNKISSSVAIAKAAQQKAKQEYEEKCEKERRESEIFIRVFAVVFLSSVVATIIFGLLTLCGALLPFAKIALIVSLCIMVPFLIFIGATFI